MNGTNLQVFFQCKKLVYKATGAKPGGYVISTRRIVLRENETLLKAHICNIKHSQYMANKKSGEKELAFTLFTNTSLTQKEIAQKCGVNEKTISNWVKEEGWDKLKDEKQTSSAETIAALKELLKLQTQENIEKMKRKEFSKNDADSLLEISKCIEMLEGKDKVPLKTYIKVMEEFMDSIPISEKAKPVLAEYQMHFLLDKTGGNK